jgi:zeaxanthin glucosyltransferase
MAKIGFFVLPNTGGMNACLQLARNLRNRRHEVVFFGLKDSDSYIRANGFDFRAMFESHFPEGYFSDDLSVKGLWAAWQQFRSAQVHFRRFFAHVLDDGDNELKDLLRSWQPDLMIFASGSPHIEWPALMADSLGIKCAYFYDALWPCEGGPIPDMEADLIPGPGIVFGCRNFMAWQRYRFKALLDRSLGVQRVTRKLATRYGYRAELYDSSAKRHNLLRLPELIPFPLAMEFPGAGEIPGRHYIEASICLDRKEPEFPWHRLDDSRPLILCALGTYLWYDKSFYRQFFRILLDVARARPDWQWAVATGRLVSAPELGDLPPNVIAMESVPQLALLNRARMMITHGGTNTIKECVYFGVPMVSFPFGGDHPGNTARVVYHGLGVRGDLRRLTVRALKERVETVDRSFYIQSQVKLMQAEVRRLEDEKPGIKLIESWL